MTVGEILNFSQNKLRDAKISDAESSAFIFVSDVLRMSRAEIISNKDKRISKLQEKKIISYLNRRIQGEPVWHILGYAPFWGLSLKVSKDVLVPRPETEMLVEQVVNYILSKFNDYKSKPMTLLDVGTGSGAIAIALAAEFPEFEIVASDISSKALSVAKGNVRSYKLKNVKFVVSDLFDGFKDKKFDIITTNLPYIPQSELSSLPNEVKNYDPLLALNGGGDGLDIYRRFFKDAPRFLKKNGAIFAEIGDKQGKQISKLAQKAFPQKKCLVLKDLAGSERIVIIK